MKEPRLLWGSFVKMRSFNLFSMTQLEQLDRFFTITLFYF